MLVPRSIDEAHRIMTSPGAAWEWEEQTIKGRKLKVYKHLPASMQEFWRTTKQYATRDYLVYESERYTYAETHAKVEALAALFHSRGVREGDRIAICSRNLPEFVFSFWAAASIGAVIAAVNAWGSPDVLMHCFNMVESKLIVVDEERAKILASEVEKLKKVGCETILVARPKQALPKGMESIDEAVLKCKTNSMPEVSVGPEDPACIYFTSGTTSKPKGVLQTNRQVLTNRLSTVVGGARAALMKGLDFPRPNSNTPQKALLLFVPLFHAMGLHSYTQNMTAQGGKIVIMHKYCPERAADLIVQENITLTGGIAHMLLETTGKLSGRKHCLEAMGHGGGPSNSRLPEIVKKEIGDVTVGQAYGATETLAATSFAGEAYLNRPTSCGVAVPVVSVRIIDPVTDENLGVGRTGEICILGPSVAEGYYLDEAATKKAFSDDGWFRTGDLGHLDEEGYLYVSDRAKDIIIRGGENIASIQVENALYTDHRVQHAAVVPVSHDKFGEVVSAVVVLHPQHRGKTTAEDLQKVLAGKLSSHCVPELIVFWDEMPRNVTGKVLKNEIKPKMELEWQIRQTQVFMTKLAKL